MTLKTVDDVELNYSLVAVYIHLALDEEERVDGRQKRGRGAASFRRRINEICEKYGYGDFKDGDPLPNDLAFLNEINTLCRAYCIWHKRYV